MPAEDRPAWYREMAHTLWRISLDQRRNIRFGVRRRLAVIADQFEELAQKTDRKIAAGLGPDRR